MNSDVKPEVQKLFAEIQALSPPDPINWIIYVESLSCCNPPMMYLQKTAEAAQNFSNEKLKPVKKSDNERG